MNAARAFRLARLAAIGIAIGVAVSATVYAVELARVSPLGFLALGAVVAVTVLPFAVVYAGAARR